MSIVTPASEMQSEIVGEQVGLIYRQGPVLLIGATAAAIVISFFGYQENPDNKHLLWFAAVLISMVLRLVLLAFYQKYHNHGRHRGCLLYTSPSPRDATLSRMPSSA